MTNDLFEITRELFERRDLSECWFGDSGETGYGGDCGNWEICDPSCPLVRLRELAGVLPTNDGTVSAQERDQQSIQRRL